MIRPLARPRRLRSPARLALLAMWLVVAGPLIGQLSAAAHAHHVADLHAGAGHAHHSAEAAAPDDTAARHWQAACGYCSLFQQMPVLSARLPRVAPVPSHAITAPVVATREAHGGPAVFPQAPTRAPPRRHSFC